MPRLNLNLSEAQSREALPDDTYPTRVMEVTPPQKGPKSPYVIIKYEVTDGEFKGRQIWDNLPVAGKGAGMFADVWERLTGEKLEYGQEGIDVDTDDLLGIEIGVVTVQEEYPEGSGNFMHKVKKLVPIQA